MQSMHHLPVSSAGGPRKKIVRRGRVLQKKIGGRLAASSAGQTAGSASAASTASHGGHGHGAPGLHRQQSSMAALLSSAHEEVEGGLEAAPLSLTLRRRERRERPPSPASEMRRLGVVASYSPYAVSMPVLMSDLGGGGGDRFRDASRAFWGVVLFCDISGFTKLAEALALGTEPAQAHVQAQQQAHAAPRHSHHGSQGSFVGASAAASASAGASTAAAAAAAAAAAGPGQSDHRRWLQRAGADTLVTIINQIFHKIVSLIVAHGGDVIKFAGDALLSVWRPDVGADTDHDARARCALIAAKAALEISACMANFEAHGVKMSVHSGIACGQLVEMHLGGFKGRWEYLIAGQPILAMGRALDVSQSGDVVAHGSVWELIADRASGIMLDASGMPLSASAANAAPPPSPAFSLPTPSPKQMTASSASLPSISLSPSRDYSLSLSSPHFGASFGLSSSSAASSVTSSPAVPAAPLARLIAVHTTAALSLNLLDMLIRMNHSASKRDRIEEILSSYIPEPAMALMQSGKELITGELRQVTILFISLPDFDYTTVESLRRNQSAVVIIQQVLYRFDGVMRQLIQDDKGTVCIVAFGLPFSTHEDDPLRGVLTAIVIKKNLEAQLGMRCSIGVTTGDAYCGVVGNENRCEYAIVGDCVNLSARLMGHATKLYSMHAATTTDEVSSSSTGNDAGSTTAHVSSNPNGGILCDGDTEGAISQGHDSSHGIHFQAQGRVPVKGRKHEVAIFTPLFTDQAQSIGKPDLLMFGRRSELALITRQLEALKEAHAGGVLVIEGEAGMGKTRIVQEVVANVNLHAFLPKDDAAKDPHPHAHGAGPEHSVSLDEHSEGFGGVGAHPWSDGETPNVRIFFGSGNSMTSKIAYSIWRNIVPGLLTELVEGRMHAEESRSTSHAHHDHESENSSAAKPPVPGMQRRSTNTESVVLIGSHGVARISSAGARRKQPSSAEEDLLFAQQAAAIATTQAAHAANQQLKYLITEQLLAVGLSEDEFCLINRFFPNNPYLQFPESPRIAKLKPLQIARKLSKVILNLLIANYHEYGPLLLVLENIQWLDTMSWRVVDRLTKRLVNGITILLTTRPASFSQSLKVVVSRLHTTYIKLDGLDQRDIEGLCCLRLKVPSMPRQMAEMITKASNGNPLFVQELLLSLQQTSSASTAQAEDAKAELAEEAASTTTTAMIGAADHSKRRRGASQSQSGKARSRSQMLSSARTGGIGVASSPGDDSDSHSHSHALSSRSHNFPKRGPLMSSNTSAPGPSGYSNSINALFSITASMQQIMTSRIDKLTPRQQDILKAASVIGMNFSSRLVCIVCAHINPAIVDKELVRMDTMGFIVMPPIQGSDSASAEGTYPIMMNDVTGGFRHAVMQDVTYKLMSKADRSALHLRVAEALELIENSREALRYLPHFTTLGLFMLSAWMEDGAVEHRELVEAGLIDEQGNVLVETDENGEPILDDEGYAIPLERDHTYQHQQQQQTHDPERLQIITPPVGVASASITPLLAPRPIPPSPRRFTRSANGDLALPPSGSFGGSLTPRGSMALAAQARRPSGASALHIQLPDVPNPSHSGPSPRKSPSLGPSSSPPLAAASSPSPEPEESRAQMETAANDPAHAIGHDRYRDPDVERGDSVPETSELVERANAAKELAYHYNMAGVSLKALVYWDLASAIFLTMQEANESKKLMQLAVTTAVVLAPIKHVKLFTAAIRTDSPGPDSVGGAIGTPQSGHRSSASGLLNLLPSSSSSALVNHSPTSGTTTISAPPTPHGSQATSTVGSLRLCDSLCLAKWERRLGESCRLLEEEDEAHAHLLTALKHLSVTLPPADTALLNPQHARSVNSTFLAEGAEGAFERVSFLTEVASVLLILSQCYYTSRPHEPLIGMHASFLCLQAAQKAGHFGMMAAAYADLLLGCLSLGDLELVEIYAALAVALVEQVRDTNHASDVASSEMAKLLSSLAAVNISFGRWTDANTCWMEAYQLHRRHGDSFHLQECIQGLALLHRLSGHLALSSALYSRLQHIASHQQHATSPYFLPRAMLGLIENLCLSGANEAAQAQLRLLLIKDDELEEELRGLASQAVNPKELSRSHRPSRISSRGRQREPLPGGAQWSSQPEVNYRWKAISLLLRWEGATSPNPPLPLATPSFNPTNEALTLLSTIVHDSKHAWNAYSVPRPAFHQLEAASALTCVLCGVYFQRLHEATHFARERKERRRFFAAVPPPVSGWSNESNSGTARGQNSPSASSDGTMERPPVTRKEMDRVVATALNNANLAFLHFRRVAEKLPIGRPRLLIWQGVLAYAPGRVAHSMSLWLEAAKLARSLALPRDVGLASYWLSQVEVVPAPWWTRCLPLRAARPTGAPSEEWRAKYRAEAVHVFTECGFGMRALGIVGPPHQIQLIQQGQQQFQAKANANPSMAFHHIESRAAVHHPDRTRPQDDHRRLVARGHEHDADAETRFLPNHADLALDEEDEDRPASAGGDAASQRTRRIHSRQVSSHALSILPTEESARLGSAPSTAITTVAADKGHSKRVRKGIGHTTTTPPDESLSPHVRPRKSTAVAALEEEDQSDSDPDSASMEFRDATPQMRAQAPPRRRGPSMTPTLTPAATKYHAGNASEDDDGTARQSLDHRANGRRRRAERAGILPPSSALTPSGSAKPSRQASRQGSVNRRGTVPHSDDSDTDDDMRTGKAAVIAATSPHNLTRGVSETSVHIPRVTIGSPAFGAAAEATRPSIGSAPAPAPVTIASPASTAPSEEAAPVLSPRLDDPHDASMDSVPDAILTRRNSANQYAVAAAASVGAVSSLLSGSGSASSGSASGAASPNTSSGLSTMFLSPAAGPKGLEAFRHEMAALASTSRRASGAAPIATAAALSAPASAITHMLPPRDDNATPSPTGGGGKARPATNLRKSSSFGVLTDSSASADDASTGASSNAAAAATAAAALVGGATSSSAEKMNLSSSSGSSGGSGAAMLSVPTGGSGSGGGTANPPSVNHSRRNSHVMKTLLAAANPHMSLPPHGSLVQASGQTANSTTVLSGDVASGSRTVGATSNGTFGSGEIFVLHPPPRGLASILAALDLGTAPWVAPILFSGEPAFASAPPHAADAALLPVSKPRSSSVVALGIGLPPVHCFNLIPRQVLFRFLCSPTATAFLSSSVSEGFDAVILAVHFRCDDSGADDDGADDAQTFRTLSATLRVILACAIQFDGRLLNPLNHHTVTLMWETTTTNSFASTSHAGLHGHQSRPTHGSGVADMCRKARACAAAIKQRMMSNNGPVGVNLSTTATDSKRATAAASAFNFPSTDTSTSDRDARGDTDTSLDRVRAAYVIAAGHVVVVECPGVQQSVRQYLVVGQLVEQALEAAARAMARCMSYSPRVNLTVGVTGGASPAMQMINSVDSSKQVPNHQLEYLGLVANILGGSRGDELDTSAAAAQIMSLANDEADSDTLATLQTSSAGGVLALDLSAMRGMQSITEDPDSARVDHDATPDAALTMTAPLRAHSPVSPVRSIGDLSVLPPSGVKSDSLLSPSHARQPQRPTSPPEDDGLADATPKLTNSMVLQKIGQFSDAALIKKAFALYIPRLHMQMMMGGTAASGPESISPTHAAAVALPSTTSMVVGASSTVCCLVAHFAFKSLDDITGQMSLGLASHATSTAESSRSHRAFAGALNTLVQVLRYLLTLFPSSHIKMESVGTGLRVVIVMEQTPMVLSCAIRLLSAFQDVRADPMLGGGEAFNEDLSSFSAASSAASPSGGAPVSCCIGIGTGAAIISGLECAEANNQWSIVGTAIDRAEASLHASITLNRHHEQARSQTSTPSNGGGGGGASAGGLGVSIDDSSTTPPPPPLDRGSSYANTGATPAPSAIRSMDNSYRILLCDATYTFISRFHTTHTSVVVERVEVKEAVSEATSRASSQTFKRPLHTDTTPSTTGTLTYRLIRFRHPAHYKLAQTSLCGRWKELQTLMSLLPTLDRIPRVDAAPASPQSSPRIASSGADEVGSTASPATTSAPDKSKPGSFVLLTGEAGVGKSHLMSAFRSLAVRTLRERIFTVRLNAADQSTPWGCLRAIVAAILETEAKYDARLGQSASSAKAGLTHLFQQTMGSLGGQSLELLPYLACLNSLLPVTCVFAETRASKQLSSGDRAEFTLTLLTYLFVFLLEPRPFLMIVHNGEFIDSLSWVGIKRVSANFSKSFFLVSAGAISAMDRSTNAGPMLKNLNHYNRGDANKATATGGGGTAAAAAAKDAGDSPTMTAMPSGSLSEFAYTEISLRNLQSDEIPSVIMNYLGLVHVASSFLAFMVRQTQGHPQLLIHSLELMLSHGSLQDPNDTVVYSLDHIMFGYANASALASAVSGASGAGAAAGAALVSNALNASTSSNGAGGLLVPDHGAAGTGMSSVLGLNPSGASDSGASARPAQVSMHELTLERIHALSSSQSLMLRVASVIGASFDARILRAVHPANPIDTLVPRVVFKGSSGATPRLSMLYLTGLQQSSVPGGSRDQPPSTGSSAHTSPELAADSSVGHGFESTLSGDLAHLVGLDLIEESGDAAAASDSSEVSPPAYERQYVFVSSAIRELVYASMDKLERTRLHTLVARYYEREARIEGAKANVAWRPGSIGGRGGGDTTADDALSLSRDNLLAYHWRQAGDQVKQFIYTLSSARKSLRMHANREATQLYTEAIALRQQLHDQPPPASSDAEATSELDEDTSPESDDGDPESLDDLVDSAAQAHTLALYSPRSRQALDPLEVLHFEMSSACRNLSLYGKSNKNLLETLKQMRIEVLHPYAANQRTTADRPTASIGQATPSPPPISIDQERVMLLQHLDHLERVSDVFESGIGPNVRGHLVGVEHPGWLLAAKSFEKIAENCLRTGEALLGFHAILWAVQYYQAMEDHAAATSAAYHPYRLDATGHAAAYGLLSVYCAAFGFKSYEQKHMMHAKEVFLSNPANHHVVDASMTTSPGAQASVGNVRVTLSNYESMYLIGMSQLDDALNLLIDMQMGAADTFLGGHRSHRDLLFSIGLLFFLQGDYQQTMLALEDVLALARAHKDTGVESNCLNLLAFIHVLCDAPYDAMDVLTKSQSLHQHSQPKTEKNVLCHALMALTNLRLTIAPPSPNTPGHGAAEDASRVAGRTDRHASARDVAVAGAGTDTTPSHISIQRSLDSILHSQHSIDVVFSYYAHRLPLIWHDCIEHMGLATYHMEVICWVGSHLDVNRKDMEAPVTPSNGATAAGAADAFGTFSSSSVTSPFAPLSEHESSQLRALHATCLARLKLIHSKLLAFEQRFPWAHALTSIVSGALIMICGDESQAVAMGATSFVAGLEMHYLAPDHTSNGDHTATNDMETKQAPLMVDGGDQTADTADVDSHPASSPDGATAVSALIPPGPSKVPLHAALQCWQSGMKLSTEHHMTHLLAHAHFLFGTYLRVQDPARRVHLQTARAIWNAMGSQHYSKYVQPHEPTWLTKQQNDKRMASSACLSPVAALVLAPVPLLVSPHPPSATSPTSISVCRCSTASPPSLPTRMPSSTCTPRRRHTSPC